MKRNSKHEKRVKKLIITCGLCAVILTASTYAWFVGMKTVNVSTFDVSVAAIDSLSLSLDGATWADTVEINSENYSTSSYSENTNSWGGSGLIPMSTVGKISSTSNRLTLYEKGSFTATTGGWRVMASEVQNSGATEANGYVAFDLFVKNLSGKQYYDTLDVKNEEAIYLTPESEVKVAAAGANEENSGIENSVRVAFAQIGRVKSDTATATITGITCTSGTGVVGICSDRDAQIWEPNDTKHVQNAINWYNTSCKARSAADLTLSTSYSGTCGTVVNGTAYDTYAVSGVISELHQVDAYDGTAYNGYTGSVNTTAVADNGVFVGKTNITAEVGKLVAYPYFTDTMKDKESTERPELMYLAPNSVTKVRVYIYLEGQDVDNYDFASLGKKISVAFGFTKERFYGEDIDYNTSTPYGPTLPTNVDSRTHTTTTTE